jgi:hypothetical protein
MCIDRHADCPTWAHGGQCEENPGHMLRECPNSCKVCMPESPEHYLINEKKVCVDKEPIQCLIWGDDQCARNPSVMYKQCPRMCGICTDVCVDKKQDCAGWAKTKGGNACEEDRGYMTEHCPFSCGLCSKLHEFPPTVKEEM